MVQEYNLNYHQAFLSLGTPYCFVKASLSSFTFLLWVALLELS